VTDVLEEKIKREAREMMELATNFMQELPQFLGFTPNLGFQVKMKDFEINMHADSWSESARSSCLNYWKSSAKQELQKTKRENPGKTFELAVGEHVLALGTTMNWYVIAEYTGAPIGW
jgi:hypothetical protein